MKQHQNPLFVIDEQSMCGKKGHEAASESDSGLFHSPLSRVFEI